MTQTDTPVSTIDAELYNQALRGTVRYDASDRGRVRMAGRDRAALLQRLTTNDIAKLQPGDGARTVLINHNARILDLLTVYALPEHLLVTTNPGSGPALARFLGGKIFFGDKVTVEDLTADTLQWTLYGPQAAAVIERATGVDPRDWPLHHVQAVALGDATAWVAGALPLGGAGFTLIAPRAAEAALDQAFGALPALDSATFEVLRIEAGYGAARHEHSTEYIPLETGLHDAISFSKGCYVGQEIIARMESRNRLAKRLMGLRLTQPVAPGGNIIAAGKEAGDLTSTTVSPRFGPIGLGYVRSAAAIAGTCVSVGDGVDAEVVELPFTE